MKICIYEILNLINQKEYIGQTTNFSRRKQTHINNLRKNKHINKKLQNAWNKYGEENFKFIPHYFEVDTKQEVDDLEKEWIKNKNSYEDGYNLTKGGQGGVENSPNNRKLNFDQYAIAFLGNSKYQGLMSETGKWFDCDSSTISAIVNKDAYLDFKEKLLNLPEEEKKKYLMVFEEKFKDKLTRTFKGKIDEELVFNILCVVSTYSRGIENAILNKFNLSKGFVVNCFRYNSYKAAKEKLKQLSKEEIVQNGEKYFNDWKLINFNSYLKIKYTDLFEKYKKYL